MKTLRSLTWLIPLVALFLFNLQCKESITPSDDSGTQKPKIEGDVYDDEYVFCIGTWVYVEPPDADPYYQYRQLVCYSCGDACFNPPTVYNTSFQTPPENYTDPDGSKVTVQYYRYALGCTYVCEPYDRAAWYNLYNCSTITYLDTHHVFTGWKDCPGDADASYHWSAELTNQYLPANSTICVRWGIDVITGDGGEQ